MIYKIKLSKRALKDKKMVERAGLVRKIKQLLDIIKNNPFQNPPPYEKMSGYSNKYSHRINGQHRLVYVVFETEIIVQQMWTHYE